MLWQLCRPAVQLALDRGELPSSQPNCHLSWPTLFSRSTLLHDLRGHAASVLCHQQSGTQLATGGADCALRLWDLRAGRTQAVLPLGSLPYCLQVRGRAEAGCGRAVACWPKVHGFGPCQLD